MKIAAFVVDDFVTAVDVAYFIVVAFASLAATFMSRINKGFDDPGQKKLDSDGDCNKNRMGHRHHHLHSTDYLLPFSQYSVVSRWIKYPCNATEDSPAESIEPRHREHIERLVCLMRLSVCLNAFGCCCRRHHH
mmetsp:Transcript_8566/g.18269  ORF Transcript_8566/g.18269 Transcript_8566/m.18269 type:complete len:134 (+) Transcript_8566:990-1391(+)